MKEITQTVPSNVVSQNLTGETLMLEKLGYLSFDSLLVQMTDVIHLEYQGQGVYCLREYSSDIMHSAQLSRDHWCGVGCIHAFVHWRKAGGAQVPSYQQGVKDGIWGFLGLRHLGSLVWMVFLAILCIYAVRKADHGIAFIVLDSLHVLSRDFLTNGVNLQSQTTDLSWVDYVTMEPKLSLQQIVVPSQTC